METDMVWYSLITLRILLLIMLWNWQMNFQRFFCNSWSILEKLFKTWKVVELRVLRADNASEFNSAEVQQICRNNGIKCEFSKSWQQFQNGKGEKCIGDVWLMTKTILLFSNVPRALWDEGWFNASYVKRHLPTTANEGLKSPIHMITDNRTKSQIITHPSVWQPGLFRCR